MTPEIMAHVELAQERQRDSYTGKAGVPGAMESEEAWSMDDWYRLINNELTLTLFKNGSRWRNQLVRLVARTTTAIEAYDRKAAKRKKRNETQRR